MMENSSKSLWEQAIAKLPDPNTYEGDVYRLRFELTGEISHTAMVNFRKQPILIREDPVLFGSIKSMMYRKVEYVWVPD